MTTPAPTAAELALLRVLWARGPATVRAIYEHAYGGTETGYTTALKLLQNMLAKGLVTRMSEGQRHIYAAAVAERPTLNGLVRGWIDVAFRGSSTALAMQALDARPVPPEELAELKALIERLERDSPA
ncbi:MAG: BlaI/MecI/CopY family transcriptional regulator [Caulobacteraceae bacterium]|nr:BlaI/MecI/CopY family transcriptional regulator [Caulobacteraceae bacterium]